MCENFYFQQILQEKFFGRKGIVSKEKDKGDDLHIISKGKNDIQ